MANSPITLQASVTLVRLVGEGTLTDIEQTLIKLTVAQYYDCEYCLAVHTVIGAHRGMSAQQMLDVRRGKAEDASHRTLLQFTRRVLETQGVVETNDLASFRAHGSTDEQIAEVITVIGTMTLGCYFNKLNQTELDFPKAPEV
jgi:AhpD family alkylhydroperoxidase